jgi:hypothetical protein
VDENADCVGNTNHHLVPCFIDRGHRLSAVESAFVRAHCNMIGTTQRRITVEEFPCTFEHPDKEGDVPSEGVPVSKHSRRGNDVALACRGFQGKVVLIKSTMPTWNMPRLGFFCPPLAVPVVLSSGGSTLAQDAGTENPPSPPRSEAADNASNVSSTSSLNFQEINVSIEHEESVNSDCSSEDDVEEVPARGCLAPYVLLWSI